MSDRPDYPNQIGDELARILDPEAEAAKRAIWRRVASVLVGAFDLRPIDVNVDPTTVEVYMPDGKWCWAKTVAWQLDPDTGYPLALWAKVSDVSKDWEKIWPATAEDSNKVAIDDEDDAAGGADYAETKIVAGPGGSVTKGTGSHGKTLIVGGTKARNEDGTTTGGLMEKTLDSETITRTLVTDPTDGNREKVQFNAVATRPTKIRYYLSDTHGTGDWTGHLLLPANPYAEANAIDLAGAENAMLVFVSAPGSPGVATWQGGAVRVHVRLKLTGARALRTYKLYVGNGDVVYTDMIWDWTNSNTYQAKESAPAQPSVTETYATLDFDLPVKVLAAGTSARLGLNLRLRAYVGEDEDALDGESLVVRVGGDNASYLDTLFTPDGGFSGIHNDLDGRSDPNCHPMASIEPGLITWNTGPTVATVDGLLTLPPKTNAVRISGTDTLFGIATSGMTPGTVIYVEMSASRMVRNGGVPPSGYAAFDFHRALGFSASPWAFLAPDNAAMVLGLSGSSTWRVLSAPWVEPQRALWPATCEATINTTDAPGLLALPAGCPGVVYVIGTALRAITVDDADGNAQAGPLAALKLHFVNDCRLYHDDPLSGWDAGLAARAAKLDMLPPEDAEGDDRDWSCKAKRTMRLVLNTLDAPRTWIREIDQ